MRSAAMFVCMFASVGPGIMHALHEFHHWNVSQLQELVRAYAAALERAATGSVAHVVTAMYECGCVDDRIARHLFVCIFPMLWAACEQQDQLQLARPVVHLLTKMSDKAFDEPGSSEMHPSQVNRSVSSSKVCNHVRKLCLIFRCSGSGMDFGLE